MSKIALVIILSMLAGKSVAQNYFVFIGAENRQPFYVRLDSQFYSSSPEGHLILSRLQDKDYNITIGFPGQSAPEEKFRFNINHKDQDFQLKSQDGGWKLYDIQGKEWVTPVGGGVVGDEFRSTGVKKDDAFSRMMAGVVRDTAILYSTYNSSPLVAVHALADSPAVSTAMTTRPVADTTTTNPPATNPVTTNPVTTIPAIPKPTNPLTTNPAIPKPTNTQVTSPDSSLTTRVPPRTDTALAAYVRPDSTVTTNLPAITRPDTSKVAVARPDTAMTVVAQADTPKGLMSRTDTSMVVVARTDSSLTVRPASPVNAAHTDTANLLYRPASPVKPAPADTSNLLYRPIAGASTHRSAPKIDSPATPLYRSSGVTKLSERKLAHGLRLVYADHTPGAKPDTVVIIIPVDTPVAPRTPKGASAIPARQTHATDSSRLPAATGHGPNADSPTFNQGAGRPAVSPALATESARPPVSPALATESARPPVSPALPTESARPPVSPALATESARPRTDTSRQRRQPKPLAYVNSDCHDFATDYDLDKLREKMLYLTKDDDRIAAARKTFKLKCFSTRQIRLLTEVFTAEATRFRFLEAAWPFAADEHFHELSDLLADPVYIGKFKVLTHQ